MRRTRRANAAITALSLGVVLGFGALAVDVAYVRVANAQLQSAIDAATLAAAGRLDGTEAGLAAARQVAAEIVALNPTLGSYTLDPDAIVFGRWADGAFVPLSDSDAADINAVRIEADHGGLSAILAGAAFGRSEHATRARALAARPVGGPASEVECYLPFALPDCAYQHNATTNPPPLRVTFGNDKEDNIGWAHKTNANKTNIENQLNGFCTEPIEVGGTLNMNNGQISNQITHVADIINTAKEVLNSGEAGAAQDWPYDTFPEGPPRYGGAHTFGTDSLVKPGAWGTVIAGPIAIVDAPCNNPKFNKNAVIKGFTYGIVYDVRQGNAHEAGFMIQLDFVNEYGFGTKTDPTAPGNVIVKDGPPILL